jgi:lipid-A-disaccharide synthase
MIRRVFLSVGEASGDQHAAFLIREMKAMDRDLVVEGIGGPAMAAAGAMVHYDTVQGAAMGWRGALRYFELHRILKWGKHHFRQTMPNLLIVVDSWSMNWHWARMAHGMGIPVMYYVAPQMWASRPWRTKKLRRWVDRVACILPFEEKFFRDHGVETTFVGHPLFDEMTPHPPTPAEERFPNRPPIIGVIPGSRSGVVKENFPNLLEVTDRILESFPKATFLVPTMPATHEVVRRILRERFASAVAAEENAQGLETIGAFTFGLHKFNDLVPRCDLCLTVSGTATLHTAVHEVPQVVVYRINPLVWHLFARWVINARVFSLVNLLNDGHQMLVPEFVPWYGSNTPVAEKALEFLQHPETLATHREQLRKIISTLNRPGASRNAARVAMDLMISRATTHG